jgi:photosynthetic reaction center cytochrome c subunit
MLKDYVDALTKKGPTAVPDYTTYQPGTTQKMAPAEQSSAILPKPAAAQTAEAVLPSAPATSDN